MQQNYNLQSLSLSPQLINLKHKLLQPSVLGLSDEPSNINSPPITEAYKQPKINLNNLYDYNPIYDKVEENQQRQAKYNQSRAKADKVENKMRKLLIINRDKTILPPINNIRKMLRDPYYWHKKDENVLKSYINENVMDRLSNLRRMSKNSLKIENGQNMHEDNVSLYLKKQRLKKQVYYRPEQIRKSSMQKIGDGQQIKGYKRTHSQPKSIGLRNLLKKHKSQTKLDYDNIQQFNFFNLQTQFHKISHTLEQIYSVNDQQYHVLMKSNHKIPAIPAKQKVKQFISTYQPINQQIHVQTMIKSNFCAIEFGKQELYIGEMIGKKKSGVGILITTFNCFEGSWKNNQKIKGVEISKKGVYKGYYYQDYKQGRGEFQWYNGELYVGQWKKGMKHGNGLWITPSGQSYNGEWKNDKIQGIGVTTLKDRKYKGAFVNFKQHGFGRQSFQNGDYFEGIYKDDKPHGKGVYHWSNGSIYDGQFCEGSRSGFGLLKTPFKLTYKGQFINDKPQGECEVILPNGDIYYGMVKDGRKNGKGTLHLKASKEVFNGYWKNDFFVNEELGY